MGFGRKARSAAVFLAALALCIGLGLVSGQTALAAGTAELPRLDVWLGECEDYTLGIVQMGGEQGDFLCAQATVDMDSIDRALGYIELLTDPRFQLKTLEMDELVYESGSRPIMGAFDYTGRAEPGAVAAGSGFYEDGASVMAAVYPGRDTASVVVLCGSGFAFVEDWETPKPAYLPALDAYFDGVNCVSGEMEDGSYCAVDMPQDSAGAAFDYLFLLTEERFGLEMTGFDMYAVEEGRDKSCLAATFDARGDVGTVQSRFGGEGAVCVLIWPNEEEGTVTLTVQYAEGIEPADEGDRCYPAFLQSIRQGLTGMSFDASTAYLPSPDAWFSHQLGRVEEVLVPGGRQVSYLSGPEGLEAVQGYVKLLQDGRFNLRLTRQGENRGQDGGPHSWYYCLSYVGTAAVDRVTLADQTGSVTILAEEDADAGTVSITVAYADQFELADTGDRCGVELTDMSGENALRAPCAMCKGTGRCRLCGGDGILGEDDGPCFVCRGHEGACPYCKGTGYQA